MLIESLVRAVIAPSDDSGDVVDDVVVGDAMVRVGKILDLVLISQPIVSSFCKGLEIGGIMMSASFSEAHKNCRMGA